MFKGSAATAYLLGALLCGCRAAPREAPPRDPFRNAAESPSAAGWTPGDARNGGEVPGDDEEVESEGMGGGDDDDGGDGDDGDDDNDGETIEIDFDDDEGDVDDDDEIDDGDSDDSWDE